MINIDYDELEFEETEYEQAVKKIEKENEKYLNKFYEYLKQTGLTDKTIKKHMHNVKFYINDFLCYYEPTKMEEGCKKINLFFSDWLIRKSWCSSESLIKENCNSLKKFYKLMAELNFVTKDDYEMLEYTIKSEKELWIELAKGYDSDPFNWL